MPKTPNKDQMPEIPAGLIIVGVLSGRRRREVELKDKSKRYAHQLTVQCDGGTELVERWSNEKLPADIPEIGSKVVFPVTVRVFASRGGLQHRLMIKGEEAGEQY